MYAILFDIDGTLLQTGGAGQLAFARAFANDFDVLEISRDVPFAGRTDRAIALDLMKAHGVTPSDANWTLFTQRYLEYLPGALADAKGAVLPGVVQIIDELAARSDVALGLVTGNVRAGAGMKLEHYQIADRFTFGGFGDHTVNRNDVAAAAIEAAAQHVGDIRDLAGAMVIGDTIHDITCARSIDAFAVAVATGSSPRSELQEGQPDLLLDDLTAPDELMQAVEEALRRAGC